ncbi:MAG: L-2-amino-thiazoline-4-carboxylic acid hydrolase [Deltaproteobacteria bacterium]|nr:L-2-amino-thiazoline-4-carboxylic acid hydrolase [Candidatus Zymogenaceae bacterium]
MTKQKNPELYYISREKELLKEFDKISRITRGALTEYGGPQFANVVIVGARTEFADILPTLPYIGGNHNFLTADIIEAAVILAFYKELAIREVPLANISRIVHETIRRRVRRYPRLVLRLAGRLKESRWFIKRRARQAQRSRERRYPGDWVFTFVPGDGKGLLYGLDFTECGICTLYRAHGADRAIPINCAVDFIVADAFGMKLTRTKTVAGGGEVCNFRYMKG